MSSQTSENLSWDLSPLYSALDDPRIEADLKLAIDKADAFRQRWHGRIGSAQLSSGQLLEALTEYEQLQRTGLMPYFYVQLQFSADSENDRTKVLLSRVREEWNRASEASLFFQLELLTLDEGHFDSLLTAPEIAPYGHHLRQLRAQAPYTLSEEVEQALKRKDLSGLEAFVQLFEELTSALRFTFALPGEEAREVTGEELLGLLYHPDGEVREGAFATFLEKHGENSLVLTSCFNNVLLDHGKESELRRYPDLMTPTLLENETDKAMVERLMEVTESNYPLAREYFALKGKLLGIKRLKNTDLYAPIGADSRDYSLADGRDLVLDAFTDFSPELAETAASFFREGRIDAFPRPGKSGGAFCMGMMPGLPPYVLLNHTGNLRDVATMAHELGHGVHFALSQKQNFFHYHAPLPMAETASVFGEMLLTRHLLEKETDPKVKIALLCAKLEDIIATTFRQNALTRFELAAHARRAEQLLSSDDLCALWLQENGRFFGDTVEMIEPYRWGWSYIGHFIHARFYCYSYVFGELLVLALYQKFLEEGEAFVPGYLELLSKGGSCPPAEMLAPLGIDLHDPAFWQKGYDFVASLLGELKSLVELEGLGG